MRLLLAFRRHLATLPLRGPRALVAVSGGPDSVALLDLLVRSGDTHGLELVVAHFNHGIHSDSARVAEQVRALAANYEIPYQEGRVTLGPSAGETVARVERYAWLDSIRRRVGAEMVFTAHH